MTLPMSLTPLPAPTLDLAAPVPSLLQEGANTGVPLAPQGAAGPPGTGDTGDGGAPPTGGSSFLVPMLVVGAIFWFVMIGPERKQRKKRTEMLATISKGTKVMTTSGLIATIVQVQGDEVTLQAAEGVRLRYSLQAVQSVIDGEATSDAKAVEEKTA